MKKMRIKEFDLDDIMKDPEKRAKLFLLWAAIQISIPIFIAIGIILFILFKLGVFELIF